MNIFRKILVIGIFILLIGAVFIPNISGLDRRTIYVDDDADPEWYDETHVKTIAEGISVAEEYDIIVVFRGTYDENSLYIDKTLDLMGVDKYSTIIYNSQDSDFDLLTTIEVAADDVFITGFTLLGTYDGYIPREKDSLEKGETISDPPADKNSTELFGYKNFQNADTAHILITADSVEISDCIISEKLRNGIILDHASYCKISDCEFSNIEWDGIYLQYTSLNTIEDCYFENCDRGIKIYEFSTSNIIQDCSFKYDGIGIHLGEAEYNQINRCTIQDCTGGIFLDNSYSNKLRENSMMNCIHSFGVVSEDSSKYVNDIDISNTIDGEPIYYIIEKSGLTFNESMDIGYLCLIQCCNIKVRNILFSDNVYGLVLVDTYSSTIEGCAFDHNANTNLWLQESDDNTIRNCEFSNTLYSGIFLYKSIGNNIEYVEICNTFGSNGIGINLKYSDGNSFTRCKSFNNGKDGIYLKESNDNYLTNCLVYDNTKEGIVVDDSNLNRITQCMIADTLEKGIFVHSSSNSNKFYHNDIINNNQNAVDLCTNEWNMEYPAGGNFWSDYTGVDFYRGPNQDIPGYDNIGDTPYDIPGGNNQDVYPWMHPINNVRPNKPDKPEGPESGTTEVTYTYWTSTIDYNGHQLYYMWDWGDGTLSDWIGPFNSGDPTSAEHSWDKKGNYNIKVKAKDIFDFESAWSEELPVKIPINKGEGLLPGTKITMSPSGPMTKNIEDIRVGDQIKSYDPVNKVITFAEVTMIYEFTINLPENYLIFNNNLSVTPLLTIYISERGWIDATDVLIGYYLLENPPSSLWEINQVAVSSIEEESLNPSIKIYDIVIQPLSGEACGYWADSYLVGGYN
ncbi:MAG: hypothetical protein AYK22_04740 [Thermoplasmatales archaeon SG8-52-3]|nr:MAG: hypothetical protein AYK22_04740 [Thermoplasmatales archaeon SG8-52-3]